MILKFAILFLIIAIIITVIFIYVKDERLTEEAQFFLSKVTIEEIPTNENNFYYYMGFDDNIYNDSCEKVENFVEALKENNNSITRGYFHTESIIGSILWENNIIPGESNYLELVSQHSTLIDSLWDKQCKFEQEYFDVSLHQSYQSILNLRTNQNSNGFFTTFDLLRNAHLALKYINGNMESVISDLSKQITHIRKLMKQADTNDSKMSFIIIFERNLELMNHLLDYNQHKGLINLIKEIEPISVQERDYTKCVRRDILQDILWIEDNQQLNYYINQGFFWKVYYWLTTSKNKYLNRNFQTFKYIIKISKMSTLEYHNEKNNIYENYLRYRANQLFDAQNFFGKWISQTYSYYGFIDLYHNVDSYLILIKLKIKINENNITNEDVQQFLVKNKKDYFNPYNNDLIKWDSKNSILYLGDEFIEDWNSLGRVELRL